MWLTNAIWKQKIEYLKKVNLLHYLQNNSNSYDSSVLFKKTLQNFNSEICQEKQCSQSFMSFLWGLYFPPWPTSVTGDAYNSSCNSRRPSSFADLWKAVNHNFRLRNPKPQQLIDFEAATSRTRLRMLSNRPISQHFKERVVINCTHLISYWGRIISKIHTYPHIYIYLYVESKLKYISVYKVTSKTLRQWCINLNPLIHLILDIMLRITFF